MASIDPAGLPKRDAYRLLISSVVPRPIGFLSTVDAEGRRNLAPFSFFNGVSSSPPIVSVAIGRRRGEKKDTLRNIEATGEFVVNLVTEEIAARMHAASADFPPEIDEFLEVGLTPAPSERVRPPRVAESPVHLECRVERIVDVHDTSLVLGEVVLFHADDAVLADGVVDHTRARPVARMGGLRGYAHLGALFNLP